LTPDGKLAQLSLAKGVELPDQSKASTVKDLMSSPVVTCSSDETVAKASQRMRERTTGSIVVTEGDRPVGILTERDLVRIAAEGTDTETARIKEWMTPNPDTCAPSESAQEAFRRLSEKNYRHIPVVDNENLVGIVSLRDLMQVARIVPAGTPAVEIPKGLEGVDVADTMLGDVRGKEGFYHYREYSAVELAEKRTFEDVWHLLYEGHLPESSSELEAFREQIRPLRTIPVELKPVLKDIATAGEKFQPLSALRGAYSVLVAIENFKVSYDASLDEIREQGMRTCAVFPTLVCALYRLSEGQDPIEPHPDLPHAANYLYMMTGEVPGDEEARAMEQYLMLTVDHGFNASTFAARVIASTAPDLGSAVIGALGALFGPLHGGAPSRALDMLEEIGSPDNADAWLRDAVESGRRLMGFGHRVYKTDDPRSVMLRGVAESLDGDRVEFAKVVEQKAVQTLEELKPGRNLYPNVEFYAGVVLDLIHVPRALFTATFAVSRVVGWTAHILEQTGDNRLIRPGATYRGPEPPVPVPELDAG
jgi:citrate synthase